MKAAVLRAPGILELDEIPDPECPEGGALIEVKACAVCGTDVKMLKNGHKDLVYPRVLGHEIAGRVAEIDRDCGIAEGDLVQVWPGIACGRCIPCLRGMDNRCEKIGILGFNRDGGFAKLLALPWESIPRGINAVPSSGSIDPGLISLAEPLACCMNGQEMASVTRGDVVLILGGGPIGCLHALLSELHNARKVIVVEKLENRARRIRKHTSAQVMDASEPLEEIVAGETDGRGVDVILTATPDVRVDGALLRMLSPGGRICVFSGPGPGNREEPIDLGFLHYRELTMVGAYGCSSRQNRAAVELLASGAINADWIITKRTSLERIQDAFSHSSKRNGQKSIVEV
ncbi:MAG TPA: alcohol dehydrogenase catalytic domain-containing protein [Methanotrichaceae archaeon]|nr:alcohol dehydrogenase catalytic domain-containing protein [Methanotrichaceae archaeon]